MFRLLTRRRQSCQYTVRPPGSYTTAERRLLQSKRRQNLSVRSFIFLPFKLQVIIGEDREAIGELLSIDQHEGVVKIKTDIKMLPLQNLCKMRKPDH